MLKEKAKFAHSERNHDPAQPLPFKGEGVRVNSESPCEGQTPALNTKKKVNIILEDGKSAAPDTDKQTNLIHKYIFP